MKKRQGGVVVTISPLSGFVPTGSLVGTIDTAQIADAAVTAAKIGAAAVETAKLANAAVTAAILAAGAVTQTKIADDAVTTPKLVAGAVTTGKIAAGAVTADEIAANAIIAGKIAAGTITAAELAAFAVTAGKIAAGAITTPAISAGAITAAEIAANAVDFKTKISGAEKPADYADVTGNNTSADTGNVSGLPAARVARSMHGLFLDTFEGAVLAWTKFAGNAATTASLEPGVGVVGAKAMHIAYDGWFLSTAILPYDASKLHRITTAAKLVAGSAGAGKDGFYCGLGCYDAAMAFLGFCWIASANTPLVIGAYQPFAGFFKGTSAGGSNMSPSAGAPGTLITGTVYVRPAVIGNYDASTGDTYVDYVSIMIMVDAASVGIGRFVDGVNVAADTITANEIAALTITAAEIAANTITGAKIAAGTITAAEIAVGTITADKIVANSITSGQTQGRNRCKVNNSGAQSIPDSIFTDINFNTELWDIGALHDNAVNNQRITVPVGGDTGVWFPGAEIEFAANAVGRREVRIWHMPAGGGVGVIVAESIVAGLSNGGVGPSIPVGGIAQPPAVGDYYKVEVWQNSGAALNVQSASWFQATHLW